MALLIPFSAPHDAASAVRKEAQASGVHLSLLPYQPLNPDAPWWLSPETQNPGYRYGKAIFTRDLLRPQDLFVGLYMEKGIGRAGAAIYGDSKKGRRYIMDGPGRIGTPWTWPSFLAALTSGEFENVALKVENTARQSLIVTVDACHIPVPAGPGDTIDVHSGGFPRDVVAFKYSSGDIAPLESSYRAGLLRPLGGATTLQALGLAIQGLHELDKFWIDVGIGLRFHTSATGTDATHEAWDAGILWERLLSPGRAWLR
ncbi:MAG: hypothetical protein ACRDGM_15295 [bacterium]